MSDKTQTIDYYTSSFTVLADALQTLPGSLPMKDVLSQVRSSLLKGWSVFEESGGISVRDKEAYQRFKKEHSKFLRTLSERLVRTDGTGGVSEDTAYQIMHSYILTENPDRFRLNTENMERIVQFYHLERYKVVESVTALVRLCIPGDNDNNAPSSKLTQEMHTAAVDSLQWLLDHGLEDHMFQLLKDAARIDQEDLGRRHGLKTGLMLVEQRLQEQATVLDLLFMLYYRRPPDTATLVRIMTFVSSAEFDFGMAAERFTSLSSRGQLAVSRITGLAVLVVVECFNLEMLHDGYLNDDTDMSCVTDTDLEGRLEHIMDALPEEQAHAVVLLGWAARLNYTPSNTNTNTNTNTPQDTLGGGLKLRYAERGLRGKGLDMLFRLVNVRGPLYPFRGHEDNRGGYQRVVLGVMTGLLSLFNVDRVPLWVITGMVHCAEALFTDDEALAVYFVQELVTQHPWDNLLDFLCRLFPHDTSLLRLLAPLCTSDDVSRFVLALVDEQATYCCHLPHAVIQRHCSALGEGVVRLLKSFTDPATNVVVPAYTEGVVLPQSSEDEHEDEGYTEGKVVIWRLSVCGWKVLLSQLQMLIRTTTTTNITTSSSSFLSSSSSSLSTSFSGAITNSQTMGWSAARGQPANAVADLFRVVYRVGHRAELVQVLDVYLEDMLPDNADHSPEQVRTEHGGGIGSVVCMLLRRLCTPGLGLLSGGTTPDAVHQELVTYCLRTFAALASPFPHTVASLLGRLVRQGHLGILLQEVECVSGSYEGTLAFLDAVEAVVQRHPHPMNVVHRVLLPYLCSRVFAVHDGWRYRRLEHRWSLACKSLRLFNSVARTAFWDCEEERSVLMAFLEDQSLYQVLFSVVGFGSSYLMRVMAHDKSEEALIVQDLIEQALRFLDTLLQFRISLSSITFSTPFEDVLLSRLIGKKQVPLIAAVFEFIDYPYGAQVRLAATRVVTLITRLTEHYHPRPPSLVGYLGPQASSLVGRCLFRLQRIGESEELRTSVFELIAAAVEAQRGLADLFLNQTPPHVSLSKTTTNTTTNDNNNTTGPTSPASSETTSIKLPKGGAVESVLSIVADTPVRSPHTRILYHALSILRSVFQSGEHQILVNTIRQHSSFYPGLARIMEGIEKNNDNNNNNTMDTFHIRAAVCAVDIAALDAFSSNTEQRVQHQQQQRQAHHPQHCHRTEVSTAKPVHGTVRRILAEHLPTLLQTALSDAVQPHTITAVDVAANEAGLSNNLSHYIAAADVRSEDRFYDTDRMERWMGNTSAGKRCVDAATHLNQALCVAEAQLSLLRAIHGLLCAVYMVPDSMPDIRIPAVVALNTTTTALQRSGRQHGALPPLLMRLNLQEHIACADLVAVGVRILVGGNNNNNNNNNNSGGGGVQPEELRRIMHELEVALRVQLDRRHSRPARTILAALSLLYTAAAYHITQGSAGDVRGVPLLLEAVHRLLPHRGHHNDSDDRESNNRNGGEEQQYEGCVVAMAAAAAAVQQRTEVLDLGDGFALRAVMEELSRYRVNDGDDVAGSPQRMLHILNLVLALSLTHGGAAALVSAGLLQVLAKNTALSEGKTEYTDGERAGWHRVWCLTVRVMCALLTLDAHPSPPLRAQYTQFVMAHRTRITYALLHPWEARPLTLGLLEEAEHVSMLVYSLSRRSLLPAALRDTALQAFVWCADDLRHSHASVVVEKVTATERALAGDPMTVAPPPSSPGNPRRTPASPSPSRSPSSPHPPGHSPQSPRNTSATALGWGQRIDRSVYSTLRCLLGAIRTLTVVREDSIEARERPGLLLALSSSKLEPSVLHALHCVDSCVDMFKKLASQAHAEAVEGSRPSSSLPSSSLSCSSAGGERLRVVDAVAGAVHEALYVCLSHMGVYAVPEAHHPPLVPIQRKILTELAVELPSTVDRLRTALDRLGRHLPKDYLRQTMELVERIRAQT